MNRQTPSAETSTRLGWADLVAEGRAARFAVICFGAWLNAADSLVTATIMPSVGAALGGYAYFGWAVAGYALGSILATAVSGRLAERIGLRRATLGAGLVLAVGCAITALAPSMAWFLAGRLVQGVGAGWISGFSYVAIGLLFPERHLARVFAVTSGVWGIATLAGPLVGGLFATSGAWRELFWLFAGQALLFSLAAWRLLPGGRPASSPAGAPLAQVGVLAAAVACLALAGVMKSYVHAGLFAAAGVLLLLGAVRLDGMVKARLLPRGAGDPRRGVGAGYAAMFAMVCASMGLSVYGPTILQTLRGLTPLEAGYVIGAEAMAWTLAALAVAGVREPWAGRCIVLGAAGVLAAVLLLSVTLASAPLWGVVACASLMGAGFGLSWSFMSRRVLGALAEDDRAVGASAIGATQQAGNASGAAIAGAAANFAGLAAGLTPHAATAAAHWVFIVGAPFALAGVAAAWRLARTTA